MDIDAYRMGAANPFERVTEQAPVESFGASDGATWYDVTGTEQGWVDVCRRNLDVTSFDTDQMSRHHPIAFGLVTHRSASFRVPVLGRDVPGDVDHLAGVCLGDRLVTFHTSPSPSIDRFVERLTDSPDHCRIDSVPPFAIALGNVDALDDDIRVYDGRLERLHDRYAGQRQERVNHRINILTLISAIFLPLSLLAGIWGMNFEGIPGIGHPGGFTVVIAAMAALALALGRCLRRQNWF